MNNVLKDIQYYRKRFFELGAVESARRCHQRLHKSINVALLKYRAKQGNAQSSWQKIVNLYDANPNFENALAELKKNNFIEALYYDEQFQLALPSEYKDRNIILKKAQQAINNCFDVLGSDVTCFLSTDMPWHKDIKNNEERHRTTFYTDIFIEQPEGSTLHSYHYDIKVPWELSRFQHIYYLGMAYKETNDERYARAFYTHVANWIENNPYLLGVNWVCPMDVSIRALNFIWGFYFFKDVSLIPSSFWKAFICSLFDHASYLEKNWENYGTTSNHYLSDLIGYFYVCTFFKNITHFKKMFTWCNNEQFKELAIQIVPDGSDYEGSTHYHKLVTEIFFHHYLILKSTQNILSIPHRDTIEKMFIFMNACTNQTGYLVQIGDNDSGKILTGLNTSINPFQNSIKSPVEFFHFPFFGISIIKDNTWHITFRHPAYTNKQPTGHFHHDIHSCTISYTGIPIIVDPGSYLYTANPSWRNYMRSESSHSRRYLSRQETPYSTQYNNKLFDLTRIAHEDTTYIRRQEGEYTLTSTSCEYASINLIMQRTLHYNALQGELTIVDNLDTLQKNKDISNNLYDNISFIFHPAIELAEYRGKWIISFENNALLELESSVNFSEDRGWYSPSYGTKIPTRTLHARWELQQSKKIVTIFKRSP